MKKKLVTLIGIILFCAPAVRSFAGNAAKNYENLCVSCHGKDGKGNPAMTKMFRISLEDLDLFAHMGRHSDAEYIGKISNGDGEMPAYKGKLKDAEIVDLVAYIYTRRLELTARSFAGDAAAIYKAKCAACHGEDRKGNPAMATDPDKLDLTDRRTLSKSDERLARKITYGDDGMPGFRDQLSAEEIKALVSYIKNPQAAQVSSAPAEGAQEKASGSGANLYGSKCVSCHGKDGQGNPAMARMFKVKPAALSLTRAEIRKKSDKDLTKPILNGKGKMPAYKGKLNDTQVKELLQFLKTLKGGE